MRRTAAVVSLRVAVLLALAACRENTDPEAGRELQRRVAPAYRSWARVPGFEARRESQTAHGEDVDVYWNDRAARSAAARPFEAMAPGSVLVKEAFVGDELAHVAVMEKRFDGWFWAEWEANGEVTFSGRPGICIDCHRRGDDFLRTITPSDAP